MKEGANRLWKIYSNDFPVDTLAPTLKNAILKSRELLVCGLCIRRNPKQEGIFIAAFKVYYYKINPNFLFVLDTVKKQSFKNKGHI